MKKHVNIVLDKNKKDVAKIDIKLFYDRWSIYNKRGNEFLKLDASAPRIINIEGGYYNIDKLIWHCCKEGIGYLMRFRNELERPINEPQANKDYYIYHFSWR